MINWSVADLTGTRVRRNHALEHATITILSHRVRDVVLRGRSNRNGFYVTGNIGTAELAEAAGEALRRLRAGEADLAIHPFCGTNLAVAGTLSGLSAAAATKLSRRGGSYASAILAALGALAVAQPLGILVQRHVTTLPQMGNLRIEGIEEKRLFGHKLHFVRTTS
jgi:hypothetical protein